MMRVNTDRNVYVFYNYCEAETPEQFFLTEMRYEKSREESKRATRIGKIQGG